MAPFSSRVLFSQTRLDPIQLAVAANGDENCVVAQFDGDGDATTMTILDRTNRKSCSSNRSAAAAVTADSLTMTTVPRSPVVVVVAAAAAD